MEQLKWIKKELGMETERKDKLIEQFKERTASLKMPEGVWKVFLKKELAKVARFGTSLRVKLNLIEKLFGWH